MWWRRRYTGLSHRQVGHLGEKLGARFLRRRGYRIVARNYTCPAGEIDLIALDEPTVVFVEVKTRRDDAAAEPEDAVNFPKRRRITAAARYYLLQTGAQDRPCRFDVVAVVLKEGSKPEVEHFIDAFGPTPR
ncbi:MAG: YraN family protein [Planctomycetota bacterium]